MTDIEAAIRAEQAAEVERLRDILRRILPTDSIIDSCDKYELIEVGYAVEGWEARRWRAALAATPVAPAPAATERCAACGHETRFHAEGQCDCEGDGKSGLCPCPDPRP